MSEALDVVVVHGVTIQYSSQRKQFFARIGGKDVYKSSQGEVEKVISKFKKGDGVSKGLILDYGWRSVTVTPIDILGVRGQKVQYKEKDRIESERADVVYAHDPQILKEAISLKVDHDAWMKRWEALVNKAKKIDLDSVR